MTSAICAHCSLVGSTPVGLCAHAWRMMTDWVGAASRSASMPAMSRELVRES